MAVVEMQKIHIVSLHKHKDELLKCLQKNEVLDIQTIRDTGYVLRRTKEEELSNYELQLAEIKTAIEFLEKASKKKKSFIETLIPPKEEIAEEELIQTCREFNCADILEKCKGIEDELANLKNLKHELEGELENLLPWRSLDIPLNKLTCTPKTCLYLGKTRNRYFNEFKSKIEKFTEAVHLQVVSQTKEETYLIIIYLTSESRALSDLLSKTEFTTVTLPVTGRIPRKQISHIRDLLENADAQIEEYMTEARKLSRHADKLKYMYDFILESKTSLEAKQKFADTYYTFVIEGWIKKTDFDRLKRELSGVTSEFELFRIEPAKGELPPVVLKNPAALSPFELITKIYGTPKYDEFDPSLPLSFFFALFFGICLGDFGYGLILAGVSIYFQKRYKLSEGGRNLFRLLLLGGGTSAIVGVLTGSYLGFSPKEIPAALLPLKELLTSMQIVDPIKSPLTMLIFSLALGVIQILFGIFLQMMQKIGKKQYVSAIIDDGLWMFFLGSLVFLIVSNSLSLQTTRMASYFSIAGAAALVLTQGRHKKNIIQKFLSGLLSLYKVSGYMGDTLSYSRLLALGMSTTIIGSVINILAEMTKGGVPILGFVLMIVILIFGHLFNLVVGTLGAFVHTTRLQMVEFFTKFYEGGGREFRPYKRQAEYTIIKGG